MRTPSLLMSVRRSPAGSVKYALRKAKMSAGVSPSTWLKFARQHVVGLPEGPQSEPAPWKTPGVHAAAGARPLGVGYVGGRRYGK